MSSHVREFSSRVVARLDEKIVAHTQQLIKVGADQHDKVAGLIQGMAISRAEIEREMRDWFAASDKEDAA